MLPNPLLELALKDHPALLRKLVSFCLDYGLADKPALIWQCCPIDRLDVDIAQEAVLQALREGAKDSDVSWWYGFKSSRTPVFNFDGLASSSPDLESGWMSEMHSDGHIIAGLWSFPEDGSKHFLSEWHAEAFTDFALLAKSLYAAAHHTGALQMTCTLLKASRLSFVRREDRSRRDPRHLARPDLQWRVRACANSEGLNQMAIAMGRELTRAYGLRS